MVKILGVCFSQREGSNSEILLKEALRGSQECGANTGLLSLKKMRIEPCDACLQCRKSDGVCRIKDDMQGIYPRLLETDGLIFSTPVYFWSLPGIGKVFLDRTYALRSPLKLMNKVGAAITVASSSGNVATLNTFNMFFISNHMITTDFVTGYAYNEGTIRKHKHAMLGAYELGRLVALVISSGFRYPAEFNLPIYYLVKEKYGIHMSPFESE